MIIWSKRMILWSITSILVTVVSAQTPKIETNSLPTVQRKNCWNSLARKQGVCMDAKDCPSFYETLYSGTGLRTVLRTNLQQAPGLFQRFGSGCPSTLATIQHVCCTNYELPNYTRGSNIMMNLLPSPGYSLGDCGVPQWISNRITNGDEAGIEEFPWSALLINEKQRGRDALFCGGVLINKQYVITAAHCVNDLHHRYISVRLGEHDINGGVDCRGNVCNDGPVDVRTEEKIVHSGYNSITFENDIAMLRLSKPVNYTTYIKPLCLPLDQEVRELASSTAIVDFAGWGQTAYDAPKSNVKRKINLRVVAQDYCMSKYNETNPPREIYASQVCALGDLGRDACRGDSGGALVGLVEPKNRTSHFVFVGISSFGVNKCGSDGWPGVFTRVTKYTDWIKDNLRG